MANGREVNPAFSLLALAFSLTLAAGAEHDPAEVLKRATGKVVANARRLPKYTCVETVTRDFFVSAAGTPPRACSVLVEQKSPTPDLALRPVTTDRLRLDVTMAVGGEIFSWVGASQFDNAGIEHLIHNGPIGTGAFGGFLDIVFKFDAQKITFEKYVLADGRSLMEYSFAVPPASSHYQVKMHGTWLLTGYTGTFQVDPESGDVVRMTIQTAELPASTGECTVITNLDFRSAQIGEARFMVPARARQRFMYRDGQEVENNTLVASCREYRSESSISFAGEPRRVTGSSDESAPERPVAVPERLRFKLELTTPINSDTAAAGDPFAARLAEPLRDTQRKVLAPAGSVVEGRLLRVQISHTPPVEVVVVLKPRTLEMNGAKVPLAAVRDWTQVHSARRKKGVKVVLPLKGEEQAGVFEFAGGHVVVKKGMKSDWRTVAPEEVKKEQ